MKAVVYTRYGSPDVLRFTDVQKPAPRHNEVLVKVHAVSLNASDWEALRARIRRCRLAHLFLCAR
jgi:NADPH:quinone reductase-like Zn-dependent oxidoreductase